jgi:thioredoxin 1
MGEPVTGATEHPAGKESKQNGFGKQIENMDRIFVLFHASWCPFCRDFLPIFEEYAGTNPNVCITIDVDDEPELCERFSVDCYPAVIFFQKGRITKRLDSEPNVGLNEDQFKEFINDR